MTWASGTPMGTVLHGIANAGLDQIPIMISAANLNYGAMKQYGTLLPPNSYTMTNATYGADLVTDRAWKAAIGDLAGAIKPLGARLDYLQTNSWDPGSIVVSALRKLGPDASAEQIRNYIANLKGFYGVNGAYDFRAVPQRGLDDRGSYMVHWDGPNEAFVTVSKAGGIPTR
jgi:branched-chain amino acid transport system substrate-binding protein